ncbi:MAG: bifunctional oligoribonuclease/PAP phosphatase NrnA [Clostridia bacterium]|nr:bifunctional oligoribonuclease/PAP phosphatase NrnA [Clostridia bacterium]
MFSENQISLFKEIFTKDNIRIIAHRSPDGDTLGSCFALCEVLKNMGKTAEVVCSDRVADKLTVLTDCETELFPTFTPDCIVTVDVATADLLGKAYCDIAAEVDYAIDHHYTNTNFAKNLILDGDCSSAGEVLFYLFKQAGIPLTEKAAFLLYAAIASDTGCFKFANTMPETHEAAANLLRYGIEIEKINKILFDEATVDYIRFECEVINNMKIYDEKIVFLPVTKEMMERYNIQDGEANGLSYLLRRVKGSLIGATLRESDEKIRISLRSFGEENVAEIAAKFGGGGHVKAAGCGIAGTLEEVEEKLLSAIRESIK